jgi:glucosamine--fructose-6-phosphate aminotransferase (isomerizing)
VTNLCGITGYIGEKQAAPLLLDGLKRLEYRGYDSAGIATVSDGLSLKKDQGKIDDIHQKLDLSDMPGSLGVGHTRWATHGRPSRPNAHPHLDSTDRIAVVHNGIIENYAELRQFLAEKGYKFKSQTDTEVVPHLISYFMQQGAGFEDAIRRAVERLEGSYALAIVCADEKDKLVAVRKESPLIVGLGDGENFIASDIPAILPHTKRVIILEDGEMVVLSASQAVIKRADSGAIVEREPTEVAWSLEMAEKRGYPHFMLKEIHEQPKAIQDTLRAPKAEISKLAKMLSEAKHIYLIACGTSYHAALVGKYALAKLAGISAEAVISSEFQESCIPEEGSVALAITQSGETADTLKAVKVARESGAKIACLTNIVGSSITRESDLTCLIYAGPEIGVAATKTFTSQVAYLLSLAVQLGRERERISPDEFEDLNSELQKLPDVVSEIIKKVEPQIKEIAGRYKDVQNAYFIARGIGFPTVMEGSLKLKEIAYIHSMAYPAGELKHGPLALIGKEVPVVAAVTPGPARGRMLGNVEEVRARGATVIALAPEGDAEVKKHVSELIQVPKTPELLTPVTYTPLLQLFAYYLAVQRSHDPDKPRHLAKSVTVE